MKSSFARNITWFLTVMVTALIQSTWPEALKVQEVLPDLVLLLVVYFALVEGEERAMFTALIGGIYQDVAVNTVLGHHVFSHVIVGFLAGRISVRLLTDHPAIKVFLVLAAGIADGVLYTFIGYVQQPDMYAVYTVLTSVVPSAFYTAILTPFAFALLSFILYRRDVLERGTI